MKFDKFQLNNGLKVIVHQDKSTPIVVMNTLYGVGAKDEDENRTGFAHLFEHLMFSGSKNVSDFDGVLQRAGGENNAFTNNDITNYYITIPQENLETAFYVESDRMLELKFSQKSLDIQKSVVIEEFKQSYLNQPYGDVSLHLRPLAYQKHPYKWSTIGKSINHIADANLDEVKDFFYKHYAPNNAYLTIAGNVELNKIKDLCDKWFGDIPKRKLENKIIPVEPEQKEKRELQLTREVPADAIFMAYHMCGRNHKDYYATDLISDLLANGKSARLNLNLVKKLKLFSELDAYIQGTVDPGLLMVRGKLHEGVSFEKAETEIKKQLKSIIQADFEEKELEKVKNKVTATQKYSTATIHNLASELSYYEWLDSAELLNTLEQKYRSVSKDDIVKVAEKILIDSNLSCIYYKSKK